MWDTLLFLFLAFKKAIPIYLIYCFLGLIFYLIYKFCFKLIFSALYEIICMKIVKYDFFKKLRPIRKKNKKRI